MVCWQKFQKVKILNQLLKAVVLCYVMNYWVVVITAQEYAIAMHVVMKNLYAKIYATSKYYALSKHVFMKTENSNKNLDAHA